MFKRTVWFTVGAVGGVVTGTAATTYGFVRLREARGTLAPDRVAVTVVSTARSVGSSARAVGRSTRQVGASARASVVGAVAEGRLAMAEAELRIIEDLDARDRRSGRYPGGAVSRAQ